MANPDSVSDTQVLLQSMLERLKLQPRQESNSIHTQDEVQHSTSVIEQMGGAAESPPKTPPMYNLDFSTVSKYNPAGPRSPGSTCDTVTPSQESAKGIDIHNSRMSSAPKQRTTNWWFMRNHSVSGGNSDVSTPAEDGVMPKQAKKQKFSLSKRSGGSVSSLQSVERLFPSTHTSGWMESSIQDQTVGQRRWTHKVKEKWKEKHKSISSREQDKRESQEQSIVENNITSPIPLQTVPNENNTMAFSEEVHDQHQPIKNGPLEDIPSMPDHMSDPLISPGSFNLMEEIFTGQEWAKFLPFSTSSQPASSPTTQDQRLGLTSCISQSRQNEQTMTNQWNYREAAGPHLEMTESETSSGSFPHMGTTEYMFNQRETPHFSMSEQGMSDSRSNHLDSMDLSASTLGNGHPNKKQTHIYPYNQSDTIEIHVNPLVYSEESVNQSQATEINNNQPVHEVLQAVDLSYFQSKNTSSLNRKRGHTTGRRGSSERSRSETGHMHEWRCNSSHSDPTPSLSSTSSTSSLQHSLSQDSESSQSSETVIKKRRMENTRRVRFAEEVTIVPPLVLSDDESNADDEDYGQSSSEGNIDDGEESASRQSVPGWIEALRRKTNRNPKFKLPRMRTKKYRFV